MLTIGKLGHGQADYYLQAVAQGIEDYYSGAGEAPGRWTGTAAGELDAHGQVDGDALYRALAGLDPITGSTLRAGEVKVPGWDLTFSAPKSVSILFHRPGPATPSQTLPGAATRHRTKARGTPVGRAPTTGIPRTTGFRNTLETVTATRTTSSPVSWAPT